MDFHIHTYIHTHTRTHTLKHVCMYIYFFYILKYFISVLPDAGHLYNKLTKKRQEAILETLYQYLRAKDFHGDQLSY